MYLLDLNDAKQHRLTRRSNSVHVNSRLYTCTREGRGGSIRRLVKQPGALVWALAKMKPGICDPMIRCRKRDVHKKRCKGHLLDCLPELRLLRFPRNRTSAPELLGRRGGRHRPADRRRQRLGDRSLRGSEVFQQRPADCRQGPCSFETADEFQDSSIGEARARRRKCFPHKAKRDRIPFSAHRFRARDHRGVRYGVGRHSGGLERVKELNGAVRGAIAEGR